MVSKNSHKKAAKKGNVKSLNLKRETMKDLTHAEQNRIKGGGGSQAAY